MKRELPKGKPRELWPNVYVTADEPDEGGETGEETRSDPGFRRNLVIIAILHVIGIAALWYFGSWKAKPPPEKVLWLDEGASGGGRGAAETGPAPAPPEPEKALPPETAPPEPSPPADLRPPPPKPPPSDLLSVAATPTPATPPPITPKPVPKATPKATPNATPKPVPKATPKATPKPTPHPPPKPKATPKPAEKSDDDAKPSTPKPSPESAKTKATPGPAKSGNSTGATASAGAKGDGQAAGSGKGSGATGKGSGAHGISEFGWYLEMIHTRFIHEWVQPTSIVRSSAGFSTRLKLRIAKDGTILNREVIISSGNTVMDDSVVAAAQRVTQIDALPAGLTQNDYFEVSIDFKLDQGE